MCLCELFVGEKKIVVLEGGSCLLMNFFVVME
jgi:hypothetical protein